MAEQTDIDALLARIREEAQRPEYQVDEMEPLEVLLPPEPATATAGEGSATPALDLSFLQASSAAAPVTPQAVPGSLEEFLLIDDPDEFVEQAYRAMLGRPADALGAQYYKDSLDKGFGPTFVLAALAIAREPGGFNPTVTGMGLATAVYNLWRVLRRLGLGFIGRWCNAAYARSRQRRFLSSPAALRLLSPRSSVTALEQRLAELGRRANQAEQQAEQQTKKLQEQAKQSQQQVDENLAEHRQYLERRLARHSERSRALEGAVGIPSRALAKRLDRYYDAFEEECRGSEEEIRKSQMHYLAVVKKLPKRIAKLPVIDVGCGRGEWLALLKEAGVVARGIDASATFARHCKSLGFAVDEGDAVKVLRKRDDASAAAISAFHLVEHLPFATFFELIEQAKRVIAPGGLLILETPNPENVLVGSHTFYHDFTHRNPVTPTALEFLLSYCGFIDMEVRRMRPYGETAYIDEETLAAERLNGHLYGPQDFAIIARKP